jgi:hypothetical protein
VCHLLLPYVAQHGLAGVHGGNKGVMMLTETRIWSDRGGVWKE